MEGVSFCQYWCERNFNFGWRTLREELLRLLDGWGNIQDMRELCWNLPKQLSLLSGHYLSSVAPQLKNVIKLFSKHAFPSLKLKFYQRLASCINTHSYLWLSFSFSAKFKASRVSIKVLIQYQVSGIGGIRWMFRLQQRLVYDIAGFTFWVKSFDTIDKSRFAQKVRHKWKSAARYWIGTKLGIGFSQLI